MYQFRYLHFSGAVLYVNDTDEPRDDESVILNPGWLVRAFTYLTTYKPGTKNRRLDFLWKIYKKTATLGTEFIDSIWKQAECEFSANRDVLLKYMEMLGLIARPKMSINQETTFFVPSMLPKMDANYLENTGILNARHIQKTMTLCLVFTSRFIPFPVFDKIIAACIGKFELFKLKGKQIIGRRFGIFKVDIAWNVILYANENSIKLTLYKQSPQKMIEAGVGLKIRLFIEDTLKRILSLYQQDSDNLSYDYSLHCKPHVENGQVYVSITELENRQLLSCCDGPSSQHFIRRKDMEPWFTETKIEVHVIQYLFSLLVISSSWHFQMAK